MAQNKNVLVGTKIFKAGSRDLHNLYLFAHAKTRFLRYIFDESKYKYVILVRSYASKEKKN